MSSDFKEINALNQTTKNEISVLSGSVTAITDTTITDHGNPATVGSIANVIAQINARPLAVDRRGKIVISGGQYTIATKLLIQDNISLVGAGVGITHLLFTDTAGGIEVSNSDFYTASRIWAVGEYAITGNTPWPSAVRFRCTTGGTGGNVTDFDVLALANVTVGSTFTEVGGVAWETVDNITPYLGEFSYRMATSMTGAGILAARCNGVNLGDFAAFGGNPVARNIAMVIDSSNKFGLGKIDFEIACNGIMFDLSNATVLPYNYGDGSVTNIDITLINTETYGLKFIGSQTTVDTINNILIDRVEVVGNGDPASVQVGVWFEGAQRNTIKHYDCEQIATGILEIGSNTISSFDNVITEYHFLPNSGVQTNEGYPWARGIPFQSPSTTSSVVVREGWMNMPPFSSMPTGGSFYMASDEGSWNRDVTVVGAPSAGLITLTMSGNIPASGGSLARFPVIVPNANFTINTGLKCGSSALDGLFQITGRALKWPVRSTENYLSPSLYMASATTLDFRFDVTAPGLVKVHTSGALELVPLASAPAGVGSGALAVSDGTGGGFDGVAGAGLYRYDGTTWVFIG